MSHTMVTFKPRTNVKAGVEARVREGACTLSIALLASALALGCGGDRASQTAQPKATPASAAVSDTKPASAPLPEPLKPRELSAFSETEVQAALHQASGVPSGASCKAQPWKHRPSTIVALCAPAGEPAATVAGATLVGPHVVLVEQQGDRLQVSASGQVVLGETNCESTSGDPLPSEEQPGFALDLAAYTLARDNTAIGVRLSCHNDFPSGEGSETRLYLLERLGSVLRQVFDQRIAWTNEDRVSARETSGEGVVIVQPSAHDGRFDLALRITHRGASLGSGPVKPHAAPVRARTQVFEFRGDRYASAQK